MFRVSIVAASLAVFLIGASVQAAKTIKVLLDGRPISTRAVLINKEVYMPVKDASTAFKVSMTYDPKAGVVRLSTKGGAGPVKAAEGRIGELLFNGKTRLVVTSIDYGKDNQGSFVSATIEIRNAENLRKCYFGDNVRPSQGAYATFTDADGNTYEGTYELPGGTCTWLVPGSTKTFRIRARIPEGVRVSKLVLQMSSEFESRRPSLENAFRVALTKP